MSEKTPTLKELVAESQREAQQAMKEIAEMQKKSEEESKKAQEELKKAMEEANKSLEEANKMDALMIMREKTNFLKLVLDPKTSSNDFKIAFSALRLNYEQKKTLAEFEKNLAKRQKELQSKQRKGFLGIGKKDLSPEDAKKLKVIEQQAKALKQVLSLDEMASSPEGREKYLNTLALKRRFERQVEQREAEQKRTTGVNRFSPHSQGGR